MVQAYILIQTEVGKAADVARAIAEIDGVTLAEDVTGPYDVIVRAEARNVDDLGRLVSVLAGLVRDQREPGAQLEPELVEPRHGRLDERVEIGGPGDPARQVGHPGRGGGGIQRRGDGHPPVAPAGPVPEAPVPEAPVEEAPPAPAEEQAPAPAPGGAAPGTAGGVDG